MHVLYVVALPMEGQLAALQRPKASSIRKVIVSTKVAESFVTIDNIGYVIDTGFEKMSFYDSNSGIHLLASVPISLASARQRAGRAGRIQEGMTKILG